MPQPRRHPWFRLTRPRGLCLIALLGAASGCSSTGSGGDPPPPPQGMRMAPAAPPAARRPGPAPARPEEPMSAARVVDAGAPSAASSETDRLRAEAQRRPADVAVRRRLVEQLITVGALGEAEGHLGWLREQPGQRAAATLLLCRARRIVNRWSDGLQACKDAAALLPKDPDAQRELGLMRLAAREHSAGLAAIQLAVTLAPGRADLQRTLGWALLSLHRAKPALVPLAEAVRLAPGDPYARTLLGDALWATSQTRHAEAAYRQAAAMTTGAPVHRAEALDKLGTLWAHQGKRAKAEAVLKACLELYPYLGCPYTKVALLPANPDRIPGSEPVRTYRDPPPDK